MEGSTRKLRSGLLENLDRVLAALVPVVFIGYDLCVAKSVAVHKRPQYLSNVRLLSGGEFAGGICGVTIPRFVLDPDGIGGDSFVPEPLQRLQEVSRIWGTIQLKVNTVEVTRD